MAKIKVVIAEDSKLQRSVLASIVKARKNFVVYETENGDEAMAMIVKEKPDVAILDVEMPGMNGLEICYRMKQDPKLAQIPVMIVTATSQKSSKSDEELKVRSRADDYITKPFQSADIYKRIDRLLKNSVNPKEERRLFRWRL
ncbi:MAG: response regulator [Planctomycetes bacterium]|nr:response regulator [Planctomycetota bacterium]